MSFGTPRIPVPPTTARTAGSSFDSRRSSRGSSTSSQSGVHPIFSNNINNNNSSQGLIQRDFTGLPENNNNNQFLSNMMHDGSGVVFNSHIPSTFDQSNNNNNGLAPQNSSRRGSSSASTRRQSFQDNNTGRRRSTSFSKQSNNNSSNINNNEGGGSSNRKRSVGASSTTSTSQQQQQPAVANPADILARFNETQKKFETQQNLKQADRLQQRLMWKEQIERSTALENQMGINKKTLLNLEKQCENLKRELASERATFDTDLAIKEKKLEEGKQILEGRKNRYEMTMAELKESRCAIARMRATLVENFVLSKAYAAKPDPDHPYEDITEEDHKYFRLHAPDLVRRHQTIVEKYIGGGAGEFADERVLKADPLSSVTAKAAKKWREKLSKQFFGGIGINDISGPSSPSLPSSARNPAAALAYQQQQQILLNRRTQEEDEEARKKIPPTKALSEVRGMLLELEKEMLEAETGGGGGDEQQQQQNSASTTPVGSTKKKKYQQQQQQQNNSSPRHLAGLR